MAKNPPSKPSSSQIDKGKESVQQLWDLANQFRHSGKRLDIAELLTAAKAQGLRITWQDVYATSIRLGRGEPVVIPPFITDFISTYAAEKKPESVLDPWAGIGSLLLP